MPWYANISSRAQLNELLAALIEQGIPGESVSALIRLLKLDAVILRICSDFNEQVFWAFIALLTGSNDKKILHAWRDDYDIIISSAGTTVGTPLVMQSYKKALLKSIATYGAPGSAPAMAVMIIGAARSFPSSKATFSVRATICSFPAPIPDNRRPRLAARLTTPRTRARNSSAA